MAGQTFRENIEQELQYLLEQQWGTAWGEEDAALFVTLVDWAVERFEPERDWAMSGTEEAKKRCKCTSAAEHRAHGGTPQSRLIGGMPG